MPEKEPRETLKKICPTCGKRITASRRPGSLTSYLFGAFDCACSRSGDLGSNSPSAINYGIEDDGDFCPKCGLKIAGTSKDGSLTGFLLQSTRCKCPTDQAFADGRMSAKFWKLKQAGGGTIFADAPSQASRKGSISIDLAANATIGGVYKIIQLIGRGGMGEVYLARHETLDKKCALKVIPPDQVTEVGWQRFQLEAKAVAKLDHINLVRVTDLGIHEGCLPFYAMDYAEGNNLAELLAERGPMPLQTILEVFMQVCDGVECAHRHGILHRDLKPANIMLLSSKNGRTEAKVLDFGLAKLTRQDRSKQSLTAVGDVFGSPFYMSPEQCNGEKLDNRSDIYSLGCTMFECLTGRPPFSGHLASAVIFSHLESDPPSLEDVVGPGVFPTSMEVVIAKLLRKNPAERYQNLGQLKSDLERVAAGQAVLPIYASRTKRAEEPGQSKGRQIEEPRPTQLKPGPILVGCLALATLVCSFIFFLIYSGRGRVAQRPTGSSERAETAISGKAYRDTALIGAPSERSANLEDMVEFHINDFYADYVKLQKRNDAYRHAPKTALSSFKQNDPVPGFVFPKDYFIAAIKFGNGTPFLASGFVPAQPGKPVYIYLFAENRDWPALLKKFGPDDLTGLELVSDQPERIVETIRHWHRLTDLSFFNSLLKVPHNQLKLEQSVIQNKDLGAIDTLANLQSLGLCGSGVTGEAILKMRLLDALHTLKLNGIKDLAPLLRALPAKDNLQEIWLINQAIADDQLEALTRMKNLETLRIRRSALTPASLRYFQQMPSLKHLYLDPDWSADEKAQFSTALPFCQFEAGFDYRYWQMFPDQKIDY